MSFSKAALGYKILGNCCAYTPKPVLDLVLPTISKVYHRLDKVHAQYVRNNLKILSEHTGEDYSHLEKIIFKNFASYLVEFFRAGIRKDILVNDQSKEMFHKYFGLPGEKANLILVGHYGNCEMALRHLLDSGYRVTTVAMNHQDKKVDAFFTRMRQHANISVSYLDQGLKPCIRALKKKEILALACERDYSGNGLKINIAGKQVSFPHGPATLISKFKPETFLGVYKRVSFGNFQCDLQKFDFSDYLGDNQKITQVISDKLFEYIYEDPSQWITFDDFFGMSFNHKKITEEL